MTIFKKFLFTLLLSVMMLSAAAAEETDAFKAYPDALGGFYGEIGGTGLSYQHWFGELGLQTAFGLWYAEEDVYYLEDSYSPYPVEQIPFSYNIGVELMYRVYSDSYKDWLDACLYVFGGIMHTGNIAYTYTYEQTPVLVEGAEAYPYKGKTGPAYVPVLAPGFGIGFELVLFNHFSLPFEFGLMGAWELGTAMPVDAGLKIQGGVRYRF